MRQSTANRFAARPYRLVAVALWLLTGAAVPGEVEPGRFIGAIPSEKPHWFKESFLEFEEDVAEAAAANKRVMLYFHQDGCPYCARLVEENFAAPAIEAYIVDHFDGIALNLWGDREVVSVGGQSFTEKTFAKALGVQYTPTLLFLDERGQTVLRLDGYYPRDDFRAALQYVAQKREQDQTFAEFRLAQLANRDGELIGEDFFLAETDLQRIIAESDRPLAVYFESPGCIECATLHARILTDPATRRLVREADNVQFGVGSPQPIVTPDGRSTTAADWARRLGIAYTPSVVFFDADGEEVMRIGAFLKTFHFQSVYAYVLERAYLDEPQFQRYLSARADHIRESGFDTDIWGYESFHD